MTAENLQGTYDAAGRLLGVGDDSTSLIYYYNAAGRQLGLASTPPLGTGSFPDFTGTGSPEGVQVADEGQWYQSDTGDLYVFAGTDGASTGWVIVFGVSDDAAPGVSIDTDGYVYLLGDSTLGVGTLLIGDSFTFDGIGNALLWDVPGGTDGAQLMRLKLGSSGQYVWQFKANGSTTVPGTLIAANLPTADPHVVGSIWSSSGTLHVSAG